MAKYEIPDKIQVPQSVGPFTSGDSESNILGVFEPKQGRELTYLNPIQNTGSTEIVEDFDKRIPLGTYTLNNRDFWENNNFNESTFQSYLPDDLATVETVVLPTPDGDVVDRKSLLSSVSPTFNYSIDALPFVINPKDDEIVHLDEYYDKDIDKENYELATEGKINYYLQPRIDGRLEQGNIDIFSERNLKTGGGGKNRFDFYLSQSLSVYGGDDDRGYYLFKLNWGDGTEIEYTDKPKLLESSVIFEHFYEKPGFYSITGIVYVYDGSNIQNYESFQTNILLNPSPNYELNLYEYDNFASIGGIDKESTFAKSLYNIVGINPLTQDNVNASEEVIEKLNTLDKLQILNILGKIDYSLIEPYLNFISPYQNSIDNVSAIGYLGQVINIFEDDDTDDTDDDTETDDIDLENYEFPSDEYDGTPSPNEIFTDSNDITWQYSWLTNEQAEITINPNYLTSPPQYDWLIQEDAVDSDDDTDYDGYELVLDFVRTNYTLGTVGKISVYNATSGEEILETETAQSLNFQEGEELIIQWISPNNYLDESHPNYGAYEFVEWTVGEGFPSLEELGIENPTSTFISVTMDNNYSILANVEELE